MHLLESVTYEVPRDRKQWPVGLKFCLISVRPTSNCGFVTQVYFRFRFGKRGECLSQIGASLTGLLWPDKVA